MKTGTVSSCLASHQETEHTNTIDNRGMQNTQFAVVWDNLDTICGWMPGGVGMIKECNTLFSIILSYLLIYLACHGWISILFI